MTKKAVEAFRDGVGKEYQEKLKEYAKTRPSYIEEFWDDTYLVHNESVVLNLNPFFALEDDPTPSRANQVARATSLVLSSLKFIRSLKMQTLKPDMWRGTPLCMAQFKKLFASCRIPSTTPGRDQILTSSKSTHIAVLCRGQVYYFETMMPNGSIIITKREIQRNIEAILADAAKLSDEEAASTAIGVLTTENRNVWSEIRRELTAASRTNARSLDIIDRALFVVCLDHINPEAAHEVASDMLHGSYAVSSGWQTGTCTNRWYDKLQLIVCENGAAGINFEHSAVDGHTVLRFVSDVFTDTVIRFAQSITRDVRSTLGSASSKRNPDAANAQEHDKLHRPSTAPRKLEFDISSKLRRAILCAETKLSDLIVQNETRVLEFGGYGKQFIVQNNLSPDAFVQLSMMMAYYRLYGNVVCTYESVQTKKFSHGRTEAARSATAEAKVFMETFADSNASAEKDRGAARRS